MTPPLLIFVDGFPYSILGEVHGLRAFDIKRPLRPGIGYSINIKSEIFGGHSADALGFFNEWQLKSNGPLRRPSRLVEQASLFVERYYYLDRLVHRAYAKVRHQVWNIPFRFLGYFHEAGIPIFSPRFPRPTILTRYPALRAFSLATYATLPPGTRDQRVHDDAKQAIAAGDPVLAAFEEFDSAGHAHGIGSPPYMEHVHRLVGWVDDLVETFRRRHGDAGEILVFSDHGMANVTAEAELDIERACGRAAPDRYLFFLDATMARVWIFDEALREPLTAYLRTCHFGTLVDEATRQRYGIAARQCGDLLLLLHEGIGLCPTFFGRRTPKALHGYAPDLASQQGILLYSGPRPHTVADAPAISMLHPLLDDALQRGRMA